MTSSASYPLLKDKVKKIDKKFWSPEEDRILLTELKISRVNNQPDWQMVAKALHPRTGKQCRERYINHLRSDLNKTIWTPNEDAILSEAHNIYGNSWAKISKLLPGRSDHAIKNHFNFLYRRGKKSVGSEDDDAENNLPVQAKAKVTNDCDLMNLYYTHDSHTHSSRLKDPLNDSFASETSLKGYLSVVFKDVEGYFDPSLTHSDQTITQSDALDITLLQEFGPELGTCSFSSDDVGGCFNCISPIRLSSRSLTSALNTFPLINPNSKF